MKLGKYTRAVLAVALSVVLTAACDQSNNSDSGSANGYPTEDLEWTVAFGPGGGNDKLARELVDILQKDKLYPNNIAVENRG